jgi:hypothetical protein
VKITLTSEQWAAVRRRYKENWAEEIKAGDVEREPGATDAWATITGHDELSYEVYWDLCADAEFE